MKNLGESLDGRVDNVRVTPEGVSSIYSREPLVNEVLTDNYIRSGLVRLHKLIEDHRELRQKMIDSGLGNLTEDLSRYGPTVSEEP